MKVNSDDLELLGQYVAKNSEAAFATLVRRHLDLVYSTALRQVHFPQLAEEVAQSVFVDLARSAPRLRADTVLSAWLYQVAHRTAVDVVRRETRRQLREQTAVMNADISPSLWAQVEPVLDDAMEELEDKDRAAIVLRFFENKGLREVGLVLGVSEDAARMRVNRALEHLRTLLERRGATASTVVLGTLLTANALQASPSALAAAISLNALAPGAAGSVSAGSGASFATVKTIAMTTPQKILAAALVTAALGTTFYEHQQVTRLKGDNEALKREVDRTNGSLNQASLPPQDATRHGGAGSEMDQAEKAELQRLRSEVAPLRLAAQELKRLKAAQAAGSTAGGPSDQLDIDKVAMARAQQLWQKLKEQPGSWIPELQLLQDEDWRNIAKNQRWDTDEETRETYARLREAAKTRFQDKLGPALQAYSKASNGQPPSRLADLAPYFDTPLEPSTLDRYEVVRQGDVPHLRLSNDPNEMVVREKQPLDPGAGEVSFAMTADGTTRFSMGSKGNTATIQTSKRRPSR